MSYGTAMLTRVKLHNNEQGCKTLDLTLHDMTASKERKAVMLVDPSRTGSQA